MAVVYIPSLLRTLTQGVDQVRVQAATVREAIATLDEQYPGVRARLLNEDGRLIPTLSLVVDGARFSKITRHARILELGAQPRRNV